MSKTAEIIGRGSAAVMGNYGRLPVVMHRGQGSLLWDVEGRQYIDLFAGFGGSILGHCHPELIEAAHRQANQLWHVGNVFWTEPQIDVAERLNRFAFAGQAFFCHSGLEANEAACKLARLRGGQGSPKRWKIISLHRSFHGRSLAMIAATGNPKVKVGFEPLPPGFLQVEPGDIDALKSAVDDETAAVIMEPIQGEGGLHLHPAGYVEAVRELCDTAGLTLIFDEVWTGGARTGKWFGYQHLGVEPDIMTLGKAMGGGLPVGVMHAKPHVARLLVPGTHGCTLGGNPMCMAVTRTIFDIVERDRLLERAARLGEEAMQRLRSASAISGKLAQVRGRGLMIGLELKEPPAQVVEKALERGVIINLTAQKVIRIAPAVNIPAELWHRGLDLAIEAIAAS